MKIFFTAISALLLLGCTNSYKKFAGIYHFDKDLAFDSLTGITPFITYKITIDSNEQAIVEISGFQTDKRLLASVKMVNDSASLYFLKYDYVDGNIEFRDSFDNAHNQYVKSVPLITFTYNSDAQLVTNWGQIKPALISFQNSGYYFSKELTPEERAAQKEKTDELNKEARMLILTYMNKHVTDKESYKVTGFSNLQKIENHNYYYKMQHSYLARAFSSESSVIYEYQQEFYFNMDLNIVFVEGAIAIRGPISF